MFLGFQADVVCPGKISLAHICFRIIADAWYWNVLVKHATDMYPGLLTSSFAPSVNSACVTQASNACTCSYIKGVCNAHCTWHTVIIWGEKLDQSVTFILILIRKKIQIYSYQVTNMSEYPNIFVWKYYMNIIQTNIRTGRDTNIFEYSSHSEPDQRTDGRTRRCQE